MTEFLKGNYPLDARIEEDAEGDATDAFEKKALARLGGSICFVAKKSFLWKGEPAAEASRADTETRGHEGGRGARTDGAGAADRAGA